MRKRGWFVFPLVVLLAVAIAVSGCTGAKEEAKKEAKEESATEEEKAPEGAKSPQDELMEQVRKEGSKLYIYDWAEWWPEEIYSGFSKEYGIEIVRDNFADMDEMFTKFKLQPDVEYDLTLPEVRVFMQMKELGFLKELNHDWLPNVNQYLLESLKNTAFDPGCHYSVPTELYFQGYCYNSRYVDEKDPRIGSWALLYEGKEYAGRITMLDDMYNVIGCALKYLGYSYNSDDEEELMKAKEVLLRQKPWVMAYDSWPKRLVLEEQAVIAHTWVGEAWHFHQEVDTIRGVMPKEGGEMGSDVLVIPKGARHPAAAHLFMDYVFRPEVNALLIETIGYAPVHKAVPDLLPEEMKAWPGVTPSEEVFSKYEFVQPKAFTGKGLELRTKIWEELKQ